ncbi:MAG: type II toxin-antitoxin system RelE/ParE family toxin [Anaerolineae bacterium]|nr:type II toxin-antitoxin system RelE/ParE family toxin [Anaerolineae bacterium]
MTIENPISVILSDRFRKDVKQLLKKYRHVREDVQALIDELEQGAIPGDQITGANFPVYKVRVKNSDLAKGKSSGYRAIYYLRTTTRIYLVTLYVKGDQSNISAEAINQIIQELGLPSGE